MILIYRPDGGDERRWEFNPRKIRSAEAELVEKRTGLTWEQFGAQVTQGSVLCRRALLWMFQRRTHPTLRFEDVDFALDELTLDYERHELVAIRAQLEKQRFDSDAERDATLAQIDEQIEATPGDDEAPKAPSNSGA